MLTVGVGHTSAAGLPVVSANTVITTAEADSILSRDLVRFEAAVNAAVKIVLNQNQFDALVSLTFNIGAGAFTKSTLLRKLNAGDEVGAVAEFSKWNKTGSKVLPGLTRRREAEAALFDRAVGPVETVEAVKAGDAADIVPTKPVASTGLLAAFTALFRRAS